MKVSHHLKIFAGVYFGRTAVRLVCGAAAGLLPFNSPADDSLHAGDLDHHLATNAAGHAAGRTSGYPDWLAFSAPNSVHLNRLTNAVWSHTFWLRGVQGLGATPIGFSNVLGGQGLPTMVSPRHYVGATHMHPEGYRIAFLDTNNVVHWRKTLQRVDVANVIEGNRKRFGGGLDMLNGLVPFQRPALKYRGFGGAFGFRVVVLKRQQQRLVGIARESFDVFA